MLGLLHHGNNKIKTCFKPLSLWQDAIQQWWTNTFTFTVFMPVAWSHYSIFSKGKGRLFYLLCLEPLWVLESAYTVFEITVLTHSWMTCRALVYNRVTIKRSLQQVQVGALLLNLYHSANLTGVKGIRYGWGCHKASLANTHGEILAPSCLLQEISTLSLKYCFWHVWSPRTRLKDIYCLCNQSYPSKTVYFHMHEVMRSGKAIVIHCMMKMAHLQLGLGRIRRHSDDINWWARPVSPTSTIQPLLLALNMAL